MKYLFLNQFSFENPKSGLSEDDILSVFTNLGNLIKKLKVLNTDLIFPRLLASFKYHEKSIHKYLKELDRDMKIFLLTKIQKPTPFCSNSYLEYEDEENIVLGDCKTKESGKEILDNFLACAMYLKSPIITPKTFCDNLEFQKEFIEIECKNEIQILKNYFLENIDTIINHCKIDIKNSVDSWNNWREDSLPLLKNIGITEDFFREVTSYSFSSIYARSIIDFAEKINSFIEGKKVNNINYDECCSHTTQESETRLKQFKGQLSIKNCQGQKEIANWHTRITQDFRLYFTIDIGNNKICFVKFTKKIS